eukprot:9974894-Prorocentrum_lima.AAC.1
MRRRVRHHRRRGHHQPHLILLWLPLWLGGGCARPHQPFHMAAGVVEPLVRAHRQLAQRPAQVPLLPHQLEQ